MSAVLEKLAHELGAEDSWPKRRKWTRAEYHHAAECGIFRPDERLELIKGEVYSKVSPQGHPHFSSIIKAQKALDRAFGVGFVVQAQGPMVSGTDSELEPDVSVVPGEIDDYADHPRISDSVLVVEVSDSTLRFDRGKKAALYAEAGVKEYWIVNVRNRCLEVYRDPVEIPEDAHGFGFRSKVRFEEGDFITPLGAPNSSIQVSELLPRKK